jgi:exodeoxyribonuclease-3
MKIASFNINNIRKRLPNLLDWLREAQGWLDAIRALHPKEPMYTYWDYMRKRWERDGGLRLDHMLLSPLIAKRLKGAGVDRAVRGKENASDHAPVRVELRDAAARRRSPAQKSKGTPMSP